jgi:hypothetical protein
MYYNGDGNWWLGLSNGNSLNWQLAGNTRGFGNLLDTKHQIFTGDFNGDGKTDLLFYYNSDGNWWLGLSNGNTFNWQRAGNTRGFGDLLDGGHRLFVDDYNGDGKADALFYYNGDGNWWLGLSNGNTLNWQLAGNTRSFGNLLDANHRLFGGDFNGDGKRDVAFYASDGSWWLGTSDGAALHWNSAGNVAGFGNLLDGAHRLFSGDYNGDGKTDALFYYNGDAHWWLGSSDGAAFQWQLAATTPDLGDLTR